MRGALYALLVASALGSVLLRGAPALALEIAKVRADRVRFDPAKGETLGVELRITAPARVEVERGRASTWWPLRIPSTT